MPKLSTWQAVGGVGLTLASTALAVLGAPKLLWIFVLALGVGLSVSAGIGAWHEWEGRPGRPRPRLAVDAPNAKHIEGRFTKVDGQDVLSGLFVVGIPVYNARDGGPPSAVARNLVAKVEAFEQGGKRIALSRGRWRGLPALEDLSGREIQAVTLEPNHRPEILDVVVKEGNRQLANGNCFLPHETLQLSSLRGERIPPGRYKLEVSFRGENVKGAPRFVYELSNPPNEEAPIVRPV